MIGGGPVAGACAALVLVSSCAVPHGETRAWPVMATTARATVYDGDPAGATRAEEEIRRTLAHVETTMSNWSRDSELSRLNAAAALGAYRIQDEDLAGCIAAALDGAARTSGAFDPTVGPLITLWGFRPRAPQVPGAAAIAEALARVGFRKVRYEPAARSIRFDVPGMEIDLGGIAKGYAVDLARKRVASPRRFGLIDLGGNLGWFGAMRGEDAVASIRDVQDPTRVCAEVRLPRGSAAATSSDLENRFTADGVTYGHIMDPRSGRPAVTDVVQATIFHPSATVTEILGKALFIAGSDGAGPMLEAYAGAEAALIVRGREGLVMVASPSLRGRLRITERAAFTADSPRFTLAAATMLPSPTR